MKSYEAGVLTVVSPKGEEEDKRQIKIQVVGGAKAIEAEKEKWLFELV